MSLFKKLLIGASALKLYQQHNKPHVIPPPGFSIIGMEHKGFGSTWNIKYIEDKYPNSKKTISVSKGTSAIYSGSDKWQVFWD